MDAIRSYNSTIQYGSRAQDVKQHINENSTQMTREGAVGLATFGTIRNSSKIGNKLVNAVKTSKIIKADKQAKLLQLASRIKPLAKHLNNPIIKGTAGVLAGLSAATALVGSTAKIADTANYLKGLNPEA